MYYLAHGLFELLFDPLCDLAYWFLGLVARFLDALRRGLRSASGR